MLEMHKLSMSQDSDMVHCTSFVKPNEICLGYKICFDKVA